MTDKELQDFIEHGENGFVEFAMVFGEGWAKHAIEIAKESRRLHEVNAELVEALKLARETAVGWYDDSRGFDAKRPPAWLKPIDDAIAKWEGNNE